MNDIHKLYNDRKTAVIDVQSLVYTAILDTLEDCGIHQDSDDVDYFQPYVDVSVSELVTKYWEKTKQPA